jgi:hypothetical protein
MDTVITGEAPQEKLAMANTYQREFGLVPNFHAGLSNSIPLPTLHSTASPAIKSGNGRPCETR